MFEWKKERLDGSDSRRYLQVIILMPRVSALRIVGIISQTCLISTNLYSLYKNRQAMSKSGIQDQQGFNDNISSIPSDNIGRSHSKNSLEDTIAKGSDGSPISPLAQEIKKPALPWQEDNGYSKVEQSEISPNTEMSLAQIEMTEERQENNKINNPSFVNAKIRSPWFKVLVGLSIIFFAGFCFYLWKHNSNKLSPKERSHLNWSRAAAKAKYNPEEEKKKFKQSIQKMPVLTIVAEDETMLEFQKSYVVKREVKPKIQIPEKTGSNQVWRIRSTQTEVFTFPDAEEPPALPKLSLDAFDSTNQMKEYLEKSEFDLAKALVETPNDPKILEAEYRILNKIYDLDKQRPEKMMCVVATGVNIFVGEKHKWFLKSLSRQNYTNFKIFHVDDNSDDNTTLRLLAYVNDHIPEIKSRVVLLRNKQRIGALANKDSTMKEHCPSGSVIVDIDADDGLVGRQVLNVLNAVYSRPEAPWLVTTNFISVSTTGILYRGFSKSVKGPVSDYRRSENTYEISHLKTYLADLEAKIPMEYMTQIHQADGQDTIKINTFVSDLIMILSMLEMAGNQHYVFLPHMFYKYRRTRGFYDPCHHYHSFYHGQKMRTLVPLHQLANLADTPRPYTEKTFPRVDLTESRKNYQKYCKISVDKNTKP